MPDVRTYVASDGGKKVVPIVSIVLIVAGVALMAVSLLGGGTAAPQPLAPTAPATLDAAMGVAKDSLLSAKPHSYKGFNAASAEASEPSFTWTDAGPAAIGQISIRTSGRTNIVLVTKDEATGAVYCIADTNGDERVDRGIVDAAVPADCTGGWDA